MSANPCNFKIGDFLEHHSKHVRKHQPPMPWRDLPHFLKALREKDNLAARVVEFQILTCTRPKEARGAAWEEIDFAQAVWIIPASRMKARREHRVPLALPALALLQQLAADRTSPFVFPGRDSRKLLGATAVGKLMSAGLVLHGFRSTLHRLDGRAEVSAEVAERCLAHSHLSAVAAAYRRTDLLDQRRAMLEKWADFLGG
jgi:integrase